MLILSRKRGEEIMIGDEIRVVIQSIDHHSVRVGIVAPADVPVHRHEVYLRIQQEGKKKP